MSGHIHVWHKVSESEDGLTVESVCTLEGCKAEKTDFIKGDGPAVAEDAPAEPRRVFGSAGSAGPAGFIEPE